jgi:hypothetical protein
MAIMALTSMKVTTKYNYRPESTIIRSAHSHTDKPRRASEVHKRTPIHKYCDTLKPKTYSIKDGEELSSGVKLPFVTVILRKCCYGQELDKPKDQCECKH